MEPMLAELEAVAAGLTFSEPKIPLISNTSGRELTAAQASSPAYWASQAREPVRFAGGIERLRELGARRFIELGPDGTSARSPRAAWITSPRRSS